MSENHIEGGELDNAKKNIDPAVDLTIDPATQIYTGDPSAVITAIAQGGGLVEAEVKARIPEFLAIAGAIGVAFPAVAPIINGLATVLKAVPK